MVIERIAVTRKTSYSPVDHFTLICSFRLFVVTFIAVVALAGTVPAGAAAPEGELLLHGTLAVGEELWADASAIADPDGGVASISYHWRRVQAKTVRGELFLRMCEGQDCTNIGSGHTYLLTSRDLGERVGVEATVTDGEGNRHRLSALRRNTVQVGVVSASEALLRVSEGASRSYGVALRSAPDDAVTVDVTGTAGTDVSVNPASLTFTVDNWNTAQTVTTTVAWDADAVSDDAVVLAHRASGGSLDNQGGDLVTLLPGEEDGTFGAALSNVPRWHESREFTFRVSFGREVAVAETAMAGEVFDITGGIVSGATRTAPPSNADWKIDVQPDAGTDVTVSLPVTSDCVSPGAVCTAGGLPLGAGGSLTVLDEWKVDGVWTFAGDDYVKVGWSLLDNAASYRVQWKSGNQSFADAAGDERELAAAGMATEVKVTDLIPGRAYTFRVIGVASDGTNSMPSDAQWDSPFGEEGGSGSGTGGSDTGGSDTGGSDTGGTGTGGSDTGGSGTGGGSTGGGGGSANRPPVVERQIEDQTVDAGETLEVDIRLNFYDRDQRALDYTVESADASVATVEVDRDGVLTIRGIARGVTAITVTAADRRDERVSQSFGVTVQGPALLALFPSASDPLYREGFVRVINRSGVAGEVSVEAIDDSGTVLGTAALSIAGGATAHFNSSDLQDGNPEKGLSGGVGSGEGDWRLLLDSELDFEALSYIRTEDGFLTAMHDVAPLSDGAYRVVTFNPGSNPHQVSSLRLINPGPQAAAVTITGVDDAGVSPGGAVVVSVAAGGSRTLPASELETGGAGVTGALGDGAGKWRLRVSSDRPIVVMSLLESPTGHLTNLSTAPAHGGG